MYLYRRADGRSQKVAIFCLWTVCPYYFISHILILWNAVSPPLSFCLFVFLFVSMFPYLSTTTLLLTVFPCLIYSSSLNLKSFSHRNSLAARREVVLKRRIIISGKVFWKKCCLLLPWNFNLDLFWRSTLWPVIPSAWLISWACY